MAYREKIVDLFQNGVTWLEDFTSPLHVHVKNALDGAFVNLESGPDPFYIDTHLADMGRYLESAALFRSQYFDLEDRAVRTALDLQLARKNNHLLKEIETSTYAKDRNEKLEQMSAQLKEASSAEDSEVARLVNAYFSEMTTVYEEDKANAELVRETLAQKWDNISENLDELEDRHLTPGHALNYAERAQKLRKLLIEDLRSAIHKYNAVKVGLNLVYGLGHITFEADGNSITQINGFEFDREDVDLIDNLILWHRRISRRIARRRTEETELTFTFGASTPRRPVTTAGVNAPQLTYDQFKFQMDNGRISLSPDEWLENFENIRVLGASVSFGIGPEADSNDPKLLRQFRNVRLRALVIPPEQAPKNGANDIIDEPLQRPPVLFDDVALDTGEGSRTRFESGLSLLNINPRGRWRISLSGWTHSYNDTSDQPVADHIRDVRISLRIRATYKDLHSWNFGTTPPW